MKLNWGNWIAAVYTVFVVFILFMVYLAFGEQWDLVAEDYYDQEIKYQEKIDSKSNLKGNELQPIVFLEEGKLVVSIPENNPDVANLKGNINFFRPSNADKDFSISFENESKLTVDLAKFEKGKYTLKINWLEGDESYYFEQNLIIP